MEQFTFEWVPAILWGKRMTTNFFFPGQDPRLVGTSVSYTNVMQGVFMTNQGQKIVGNTTPRTVEQTVAKNVKIWQQWILKFHFKFSLSYFLPQAEITFHECIGPTALFHCLWHIYLPQFHKNRTVIRHELDSSITRDTSGLEPRMCKHICSEQQTWKKYQTPPRVCCMHCWNQRKQNATINPGCGAHVLHCPLPALYSLLCVGIQ